TRPGSTVVGTIQDRATQKRWLSQHGFPIGPYRDVSSLVDVATALKDFGDTFVKANRGGYDGRSQVRASRGADAGAVWKDVGGRPAVAERALDLAGELSVMVA